MRLDQYAEGSQDDSLEVQSIEPIGLFLAGAFFRGFEPKQMVRGPSWTI